MRLFLKTIYIFICGSLTITLCACTKQEKQSVREDMTYNAVFSGPTTFGANGFLHQSHDGILFYFDSSKNTDSSICTRADCEHKVKNSDGTVCDAYFPESTGIRALYGNRIYYVIKSPGRGVFKMELWSMDLTGNDRKQLAEIDGASGAERILCGEGKIVLAYSVRRNNEGELLDKRKAKLWIYNIDTQKSETVLSEEDYMLSYSNCWLEGDKVWYLREWIDEPVNDDSFTYEIFERSYKAELHVIDIPTGTKEMVLKISAPESLELDRNFIILNDKKQMIDLRTGSTVDLPDVRLRYCAYLDRHDCFVGCSIKEDKAVFYLISFSDGEQTITEIDAFCIVFTENYIYGTIEGRYSYIKTKDLVQGRNTWSECNLEAEFGKNR